MFPHFKEKWKLPALFTPKEYIKKIAVPANILLCYHSPFVRHLQKNFKLIKKQELYHFQNIGIMEVSSIGGSACAIYLEHLIARGAKKFILFGLAGSLQKEINHQDLVLCSGALRDEGTSHHYLPPSDYIDADRDLSNLLEQNLNQQNLAHFKGRSWTTDAVYRETKEEIKTYQGQGILTVEMEAASFFAVAKYHNVQASALFMISDSLAQLRWEPNFRFSKKDYSKIFTALLNTFMC